MLPTFSPIAFSSSFVDSLAFSNALVLTGAIFFKAALVFPYLQTLAFVCQRNLSYTGHGKPTFQAGI